MDMNVLDGVRIVDFTRHMAGPFATVVLADHGADVVKVESLPDGDATRHLGVDFVGDESAIFLIRNRGKRSIALDLRSEASTRIVHRLVEAADVVIENYRPGVAEKIGIGYGDLAPINPRLIYCSVSAFGSTGPLATSPGTDPVVQATSGIMSVTGEPDRGPALIGVPLADFTGSMLAVQGILFALLARERTGRGQKVDISMLYGMLSMLTTRLASYWSTGENPQRSGSAHSSLVPYQVFQTADGDVMAGSFGESNWPRFCEAVGLPELADDHRFRTLADRQRNRGELVGILERQFATQPADHWEERFQASGALFAHVNRFSDILSHPQVEQSGLLQTVEHTTLGAIPQLGPPIGLSETPPRITLPPPVFGEHTSEVLSEVGFRSDEIEQLLRDGVARQADLPER